MFAVPDRARRVRTYPRRLSRLVAALLITVVAGWAMTAAVSSASTTLFNNMGTPRTSNASDTANKTTWLAYRFHPTASGTANLISVQAECTSNGVACLPGSSGTMSIYTDFFGHPFASIATTGAFNPPLSAPVSGNCLVVPSPPTLTKGVTYWAVMKGTSDTYINWLFQNDTAENNAFQSVDSGATWTLEIPTLRKPLTLRVDQGSACGGHLVPNPVAGTTIGGMFPQSGHQDVNTITLSNDGISDLHLTGYTISGGNGAADFQVLDADVKNSPTPPNPFPQQWTLVPNALVILYVTCTGPQAEGHYTATLKFTTDDSSNPSISWPLSCYVDNTPPVIHYTITPNGNDGWFKTLSVPVFVFADDGVNGSGANLIFCSVNGAVFFGENSSSTAQMYIPEPPAAEGATNTVSCNAGDVAGNITPTPALANLKIDTRAPVISANLVPSPNAAGWNNTNVTVGFSCTDPTPGSGLNTNTVGGGSFTGETAGTIVSNTGGCDDVAGNTGASKSVTLKIDKKPPVTQITSAPPARTKSTSAQFSLGGTDNLSGIASFVCVLDGAPVTCAGSTATFSGLAGGPHSLSVKAVDAAGNTDPTGKTATWLVDLTPPFVTFDSPAEGSATQIKGSVSFHATDPDDSNGFTFTCQLDGAASSACTSPVAFSYTATGLHDLTVTATDRLGNIGSSATLDFTVDATAPTITFTSPPEGGDVAAGGAVNFTITDPDDPTTPGATCALDSGPAVVCSSSFSLQRLAPGLHTLLVTSSDRAGNTTRSSLSFHVTASATQGQATNVPVPASGAGSLLHGVVVVTLGIALGVAGTARRRRR